MAQSVEFNPQGVDKLTFPHSREGNIFVAPASRKEISLFTSPNFETLSPMGEENRAKLIKNSLENPDVARELWRSSENLDYITQNEASHRALDRVYSGPILEKTPEGYHTAEAFLANLHTAMGARNRFRIVQNVYAQEIASHFSLNGHSGEMNTLSIAAGSSKAVMEKMAGVETKDRERMNLRLVDLSDSAISDAKDLASELGINDSVDVRQTNFLRFNRYLEEGYSPRFTEIVGLFDYVPDNMVVRMLERMKEQMPDGGSVLYSSVTPNDEQEFLHDIIGWRPMIYRGQEEMADLASQAGFSQSNIELIEEPLKMCNLVLARK